jgi:hypothetical protein
MACLLGLLTACNGAHAAAAPAVDMQLGVFEKPADVARLMKLTRAATEPLASANAVRGKFSQQRFLAELAQPLASSGSFLFARNLGIDWHTKQPFDSQLVLSERGILQRDEGGQSLRLDAAEQPGLAVVSRILLALFALDFATLSRDFELFGEPRGAGWTLGLKPRAQALRGVFKLAVVSGGSVVERVFIEDGNGDRSLIELHEVLYGSTGPTPEERGRF